MWCTVDLGNAREGWGEDSRELAQYGAASYIRPARVVSGYRYPWPTVPVIHCARSGAARPTASEPQRSDSDSSTEKTLPSREDSLPRSGGQAARRLDAFLAVSQCECGVDDGKSGCGLYSDSAVVKRAASGQHNTDLGTVKKGR